MHCLQPNPASRYADMDQVHTDLDRHLHNLPPRYASTGWSTENLRKWWRRHPVLRSAGFIASAAVLLVALLSSWFAIRNAEFTRTAAQYRFAAWQREIPEIEARLASADFGGGDIAAAVSNATDLIQRFELDDQPLPNWTQLIQPSQRLDLTRDLLQLHWLIARDQLAVARLDPDAGSERHLAMAREHHQRARRFGSSADMPLMVDWQASVLNSEQQLDTREQEAAMFSRWLDEHDVDPTTSAIAWTERRMIAFETFASGRPAPAITAIETGLNDHTNDYAAWIVLGHAYAHQRQLDRARASYFVAQTLRPKSPQPYFFLGLAAMDAGQFEPASEAFDVCLQLDPNDVLALANRGMCRQRLGLIQDAVADCERALELGCKQTRLCFVLSQLYQVLGQSAESARWRARDCTANRAMNSVGWHAVLLKLPTIPRRRSQTFNRR